MRKSVRGRIHSSGLIKSWLEQLRRREQMLIRGPERWPLLLLSYPGRDAAVAEELREAWLYTLPSLTAAKPYLPTLERLPAIIVVLLRAHNVCTCLGHHHMRGTESRLTRRLAADMGSEAGEIDLAWEAIREWRPHPLTTMRAEAFEEAHFRTGLLAVLLHELEHLAYPDHQERAVRHASDDFYREALLEIVEVAR
ncbi:MAG TPA: hypothetical protein VM120_14850 [Bryobacteraceae bacterium]|nr:hypothetical protein [Bryobacteraceae bacterium]